jgi:hypothetical protein
MKKINFISSLSLEKQEISRKIAYVIMFLLCAALSLAVTMHTMQYKSWQVLEQNKNDLQHKLQILQESKMRYEKVMLEQKKLQNWLLKLGKRVNQPKSPYDIISEINKSCTKTNQLQSLSLRKKQLELQITCAQTKNALAFIKTINEKPIFAHLTLESMQKQPQTSHVLCTIKGTLCN